MQKLPTNRTCDIVNIYTRIYQKKYSQLIINVIMARSRLFQIVKIICSREDYEDYSGL